MVKNLERTKCREKSNSLPPAIQDPSEVLTTKVLISRNHSRNILCTHIYYFLTPPFLLKWLHSSLYGTVPSGWDQARDEVHFNDFSVAFRSPEWL